MNTAPSIYQFRNRQDFETAMAEWCAENEPRIIVRDLDLRKDTEVATLREARELQDKLRMAGGRATHFVMVGNHIFDADYYFGYRYTAPSTCKGDYNADKHSIGRK